MCAKQLCVSGDACDMKTTVPASRFYCFPHSARPRLLFDDHAFGSLKTFLERISLEETRKSRSLGEVQESYARMRFQVAWLASGLCLFATLTAEPLSTFSLKNGWRDSLEELNWGVLRVETPQWAAVSTFERTMIQCFFDLYQEHELSRFLVVWSNGQLSAVKQLDTETITNSVTMHLPDGVVDGEHICAVLSRFEGSAELEVVLVQQLWLSELHCGLKSPHFIGDDIYFQLGRGSERISTPSPRTFT